MTQLSKSQFMLLSVLLVRDHALDELQKRWPYALRTVRAARRKGLVEVHGGNVVSLSIDGREYFARTTAERTPELVT